MKNISLMKVTAMVVVVTVALASSFVNAEDKLSKAVEKVDKVIEQSQSDLAELAKELKFSTLLENLDSDKNGMLNQAEVSSNQSQLLHKEFTKMDVNQDNEIDEAEYNTYLSDIKEKAAALVKSAI
jgi:hypothetical protein